jgi:hypothetical protein
MKRLKHSMNSRGQLSARTFYFLSLWERIEVRAILTILSPHPNPLPKGEGKETELAQ